MTSVEWANGAQGAFMRQSSKSVAEYAVIITICLYVCLPQSVCFECGSARYQLVRPQQIGLSNQSIRSGCIVPHATNKEATRFSFLLCVEFSISYQSHFLPFIGVDYPLCLFEVSDSSITAQCQFDYSYDARVYNIVE